MKFTAGAHNSLQIQHVMLFQEKRSKIQYICRISFYQKSGVFWLKKDNNLGSGDSSGSMCWRTFIHKSQSARAGKRYPNTRVKMQVKVKHSEGRFSKRMGKSKQQQWLLTIDCGGAG